jgi:D-inositol-3-phosphate glycosyltransferase
MRVAEMCAHSCPMKPLGSEYAGGMNLYVRQLSQELGKLGLEIDIFTRRHDTAEPEVMPVAERVRLIHIDDGEPEDVPVMRMADRLPQFLDSFNRFRQLQHMDYDLVHSHYWLSAWAMEKLRERWLVPHVATFHTLGEVKNWLQPVETEPQLRLAVERECIAAADGIIAFTGEEKDNLIGIYGAREDSVTIIPAGVDLVLFHPVGKAKARRQLGFDLESKLLLFAGRLDPIKGVDILLNSMTCLTEAGDVHLLVVGGDTVGGGEMARLVALAGELGITDKVTFLGAIEHERMPLFYNAADVCVVPSYHESFGLAALEALACGTPVVAARVGGLATIIIDGETGYLLNELSPEALARCLRLILEGGALRERMGEAAVLSAGDYTWPAVARRV